MIRLTEAYLCINFITEITRISSQAYPSVCVLTERKQWFAMKNSMKERKIKGLWRHRPWD